jgi:hypothetical protein
MFETRVFCYSVAEILDEKLEFDIEVEHAFIEEMKGRIREIMIEEGVIEGGDLEIFIVRIMKTFSKKELFDMIISNQEEIYNFYQSIKD